MFEEELVLVDESRDDMYTKLERWPEALDPKGFKATRINMDYMIFNFSGGRAEGCTS